MDNNKIEVKKLSCKDLSLFQKLIILFKDVFETNNHDTGPETYLTKLLAKPGFIALVIFYEDELAGGLTAYELPMYYSDFSEMYIYDIGIKVEFQRKGLGKKLLLALKEYCRENRITLFFVEAHEEDDDAVNFYHSAGGKAEKVVHFNFECKE